ncbi:MAG: hypothetical protein KatS3mg095_0754 [Candidatus Parcubacteria bacterium]|nr:MAG: hypothetical protein KatS3mg095_0754 [Candidatus Parcubacteria bacterium]
MSSFQIVDKNFLMVSCIIPAYNEEKYIKNTIESIKNSGLVDEIIVIDDGSTDNTNKIVQKLNYVKIITNKKNLGKAQSILRGVKLSMGNIILICDADLQGINFDDLSKLINPIKNNKFDITIASNIPFVIKRFSGLRCLKKEIFKLIDKNNLSRVNYNIEEIINEVIKNYNLKFKYIKVNKIRNVHKIIKYGLIKGTYLSLKMYLELINYFIKKIW